MTKKNWIVFGCLVGMLILLMVMVYFYIVPTKSTEPKVDISVVVYGSSTGRWTAFKEGVNQAAKDLGAMVNFVIMEGTDDCQEQKELLTREVDNGAKGLVVAVADSEKMSDYLVRLSNLVSVVLVESEIDSENVIPCVKADAYEMGEVLAKHVLAQTDDEELIKILPVEDNRMNQKERLEGFMDEMSEACRKVEMVDRHEEKDIRKIIEKEESVTFVALNDKILEQIADILGNRQSNIKLYGMGSSERIVYALDRGVISEIVFQNEFIMGYEAVDALIGSMRKEDSKDIKTIAHHQVSTETLHLQENEQLLYPIIH